MYPIYNETPFYQANERLSHHFFIIIALILPHFSHRPHWDQPIHNPPVHLAHTDDEVNLSSSSS